jgi:hypothetical protein
MGTYSICDSVIYVAGVLPQSYCQDMTLFVWLALFRSPGVSPAAKARPRLVLFWVLLGELLDGLGGLPDVLGGLLDVLWGLLDVLGGLLDVLGGLLDVLVARLDVLGELLDVLGELSDVLLEELVPDALVLGVFLVIVLVV